MTTNLILASTSTFKKQLLNKLKLPFHCFDPKVDETPQPHESATELVLRLAKAKALAGKSGFPKGQIIATDQVAVINEQIIGKPLNRENAITQLTKASGQSITFYTGLALWNGQNNHLSAAVEPFTVHFRTLSPTQIQTYVDKEQPFWCAGSFKSEGLGIALFHRLEGRDPNNLIGLPLILLIDMLTQQGIDVLSPRKSNRHDPAT